MTVKEKLASALVGIKMKAYLYKAASRWYVVEQWSCNRSLFAEPVEVGYGENSHRKYVSVIYPVEVTIERVEIEHRKAVRCGGCYASHDETDIVFYARFTHKRREYIEPICGDFDQVLAMQVIEYQRMSMVVPSTQALRDLCHKLRIERKVKLKDIGTSKSMALSCNFKRVSATFKRYLQAVGVHLEIGDVRIDPDRMKEQVLAMAVEATGKCKTNILKEIGCLSQTVAKNLCVDSYITILDNADLKLEAVWEVKI